MIFMCFYPLHIFQTKMSPNWTEFPLTYPTPFSLILLNCSPKDLLACRATCVTWRSWFTSSSSIWSKFLTRMLEEDNLPAEENDDDFAKALLSYRMRKLIELDTDTEEDCFKICMKISRALKENVSTKISQESMKRVKRLESIIPVMGPPAIFIRLKVNHPKIKKIVGEMVCRYLSCIILDRQDSSNDYVKRIILKSMYGPDGAQNWVYVNNLRPKDEEDELVSGPEGVVLEGEHRLAEALRMSMQSSSARGEKRKNEEETEEEANSQPCKKVRLEESDQDANEKKDVIESKDEGQNNAETESNDEEEDTEDDNDVKSIYAIEEAKKYIFFCLFNCIY